MLKNMSTKNLILLQLKTTDATIYNAIKKELKSRQINNTYKHTTWLDDYKIDTCFVTDRLCYETLVTNYYSQQIDCVLSPTPTTAEKIHQKFCKKYLTNK